MPADGTSLPSPPRKFRHPSRVRGSSQKIARVAAKGNPTTCLKKFWLLHCTRTMCNDFASNARGGLCNVCMKAQSQAKPAVCLAHGRLCNVCKVQNFMHAHHQPKGVCGMCTIVFTPCIPGNTPLIPSPKTPNHSSHRAPVHSFSS